MATRDPKEEDGGGPLKNGTTAAEDSDDSSGGPAVLGKKSRSPAQHTAMDGFQDGGPPRPPNSMDGYPDPRSQQHYPQQQQQNFANNNNPDDNSFRPDYPQEMGGNSYGRFDQQQQQHGGPQQPGNNNNNDVTNSNKMYPQQYMRPPFSPRGPQRAQPPYGGSRFVSGPSLSQQTGPTPTLNQLLQAPNSLQRYQHNSYDYPNQKGDGAQHYPGPNNTWGGGRYPQQHSAAMYRNQQQGEASLKRSYPGQMPSPGGGAQPYPQQQQQYHPYPNTQGPTQGQPPRHNYPQQTGQQQQQQYPGGQGPPMPGGGYEGGPRPQMGPYSGGPPPSPAPPPPAQQHLPPPTPQQQPPQQQQPQPADPLTEEGGSSSSSDAPPAPPLRTTPPGASPHRPAPSPSGSPSMSPALGQPPSMPPRPPSTQSENSGQQPPPAPQGYNQQMAPPGMYGNKMHQNMMGSSHPYSPSSHYPQGGYHRAPGSLQPQMHSGGGYQPQQPPSSSSSPYPRAPIYPPAQSPAAGAGYQPPYPGGQGAGGYGGQGGMMPPPNHYPKAAPSMPPPAPAAGAQAAAQAAVIAAAQSSGGVRPSPAYLRQHLQQKMYNSGGYGGPQTQDGQPPQTTSPGDATAIGLPPTTVAPSISSPSTVTVSSPSEMMQQQSPRNSMGPPLMDEGSQASNASASSSVAEERVETPKPSSKQQQQTLPSPGAASMSSFHDDFESVSSPSWPRTPASPVINNQPYDHHPIKRPDGMLKLYDMSEDPDRRLFLDKLILYQEERGTPLSQCPTISKQPLDLYRLYLAAKERGGFVEVMKGKMWKEIAGLVGIGASSSAAYTLRKQYIKHLLPFECKFDRGGIDPVPLISSLESNSRKKNAKNAGGSMMDGYPGPYPGGYPSNAGPGMMPGGEYPGHHPTYPDAMHHPANHSEGAMDPFSDDMQGAPSQYPQRHNSDSGGYASYPPPSAQPYPGATPGPPGSFGGYGDSSGPQQPPYSEAYPSTEGGGYGGGRGGVPPLDPYAPPPGGYPPNRTVGPPANAAPGQYPPYQSPCGDQERFGDSQNSAPSPMIRPSTPTSSVIGPSPQQDSSSYPTPHPRYPSQPTRESMPPQQPMGAYQGSRPALGPAQYPNSQPYQAQTDNYSRGPDFQPQMSRLQSTLIQRLLPKNQTSQSYPPSQSQTPQYGGGQGGSMPPPNKVAPPGSIPGAPLYPTRDLYPMGPKRHNPTGDYPKGHDQYHHYPQQQTPSQQPPYSDRSQYPYRPSHGMPPQSAGPPPPPSPQQGWPRDGRSYGPSQYPPGGQQRDSWEMSREWQQRGYGPPQPPEQAPYPPPPHMGKMMARTFPPHNKMTPHPPPQYGGPSPQQQQQRRDLVFPPDSVEAVPPLLHKRRRLLARDVSPVDPWRLLMALKSGLLGESTWALDVLAVLVCDDASVLWFGLSHLQGLLEVLMDHYRRCLNLMFSDLASDTEVGCGSSPSPHKRRDGEKKWYELDADLDSEDDDDPKGASLPPSKDAPDLSGDRVTLLDTPNYTHRTRCRKSVRTQDDVALFLTDPQRRWDVHEGGSSSLSQHGGGEYNGHIQAHFEDTRRRVRFVRVLEGKGESVVKDSKKRTVVNGRREGGGSDTEEDDVVTSPKRSPLSGEVEEKCEEVDRISKDPCRKEGDDPPTESVNSSSNSNNVTAESERTRDSEAEKSDIKEKDASGGGDDEKEEGVSDFPKIRPVSPSRKRRALEDLEDESYTRDEPSLCTMTDAQDSLARRCIAASSILRNLSFVPGNDTEMSKHSGFLLVLGRLLLLHHSHPPRRPPQRHYDREGEGEGPGAADSCSSLGGEGEWWWEALHLIRENTLVTLANISGQLDLAPFPEEISFPILDGLVHWVTCPSSHARDPLPTQPPHSVLSPQRLSLEALSKLSVLESNVDLMMATPPWPRTDRLLSLLSKWLARNEDQVLREFSVVLLSNLSQADSAVARAIALQPAAIPLLLTFVEQAEQSALQVANAQGINALRENPELMGTTLDMVRRAAGTLRCLARVPANRCLFVQHQGRLLSLVMSQILDQGVAGIVADVLYECSRGEEGGSSGLTDDT